MRTGRTQWVRAVSGAMISIRLRGHIKIRKPRAATCGRLIPRLLGARAPGSASPSQIHLRRTKRALFTTGNDDESEKFTLLPPASPASSSPRAATLTASSTSVPPSSSPRCAPSHGPGGSRNLSSAITPTRCHRGQPFPPLQTLATYDALPQQVLKWGSRTWKGPLGSFLVSLPLPPPRTAREAGLSAQV